MYRFLVVDDVAGTVDDDVPVPVPGCANRHAAPCRHEPERKNRHTSSLDIVARARVDRDDARPRASGAGGRSVGRTMVALDHPFDPSGTDGGRRGAREDVGVTHIRAGDVTFGEGLLFDPRARKGSGIDRNQSTLAREGTMVGASSHAREPTPRPPLVSDVATGSVVRSGRSQRTVRLPLGERKASKDS